MKIIGFDSAPRPSRLVLALGNFDGVHKGHIKLITSALRYARKRGLKVYAMTFDPHPQEVVDPGRGLCLLTTLGERIELMRELGLDGVFVQKFDRRLASLLPEDFVRQACLWAPQSEKGLRGF